MRQWAFFLLILPVFLSSGAYLEAQQGQSGDRQSQNSGRQGSAARQNAPYLIPQTVFVGDKARLIVPLETVFAGIKPFVLEDAALLPRSRDIRIHRLEMERRGGMPQLLIDFTAYIPGELELPPITELGIAGLTVNIASILGGGAEGLVLSNPAPPLPAPGTMFIIYGTVTGIILLILAIIGGRIWSKRHPGAFLERWRRRRLLYLMGKVEARLRLNLIKGNLDDYKGTLASLSTEFRSFLGYFSNLNCRAMTAGEFFDFPPLLEWADVPGGNAETAQVLSGEYLGTLFRRFDRLRFSGERIEKEDVAGILDGVKLFITTLGQVQLFKGKN
jgi:hypothetical protein